MTEFCLDDDNDDNENGLEDYASDSLCVFVVLGFIVSSFFAFAAVANKASISRIPFVFMPLLDSFLRLSLALSVLKKCLLAAYEMKEND